MAGGDQVAGDTRTEAQRQTPTPWSLLPPFSNPIH
jgi:hypothetical protein